MEFHQINRDHRVILFRKGLILYFVEDFWNTHQVTCQEPTTNLMTLTKKATIHYVRGRLIVADSTISICTSKFIRYFFKLEAGFYMIWFAIFKELELIEGTRQFF